MAGGVGAEAFGSPRPWLVDVVTLAIVLFFNYFTRGICKLASILLGMIFGYALALSLIHIW